MKKIYRLKMITQRSSKNRVGYFLTIKQFEKIRAEWEEIVEEEDDVYGDTYFEVKEIELGVFN